MTTGMLNRSVRVLVRLFYRLLAVNKEAIPSSGGALIVANHLSFIDILFLAAAVDRPVRFVTDRKIYNNPWLKPFCRAAGAFPVSPKDSPKEIARSLADIRRAIESGDLVCMFPEGGLSRTGNTLRFSRGLEHIMRGIKEPIIPAYLDRTWNSIWGFEGGRYFLKRPRFFAHPVTVMFGAALPSSTRAFDVRQKVLELGSQAFRYRLEEKMTLAEMFFNEAKRNPFGACIADALGKKLSRWETFAAAYALSAKLRVLSEGQEYVATLLPTSVGGAITNIAVGILGKPIVNLNYTASREARESAVTQCGLKLCVTTRAFLEKLQLVPPCEVVYLDDIAARVNFAEKLRALALIFLMPRFVAHRIVFGSWHYRSSDDVVTVVFTSGSTGIPKGVMLTHANITANLEGFHQAFQARRGDVIMGILPFFHSFGFTAVLWLPLASVVSAVYHPSLLDAKVVGDTIRKWRATFLMATPTFVSAYTKRCETEDFKSIRFTIIGAEKLKPSVAQAFTEKFGFAPLEGYGCTELSPIVSLNFPDYRKGNLLQKAQKPGTIGNPLPGVAVRVVDPETYEVLPPGKQGLLVVKGQNVMKGYLNQPERTREAFVDGWYKTGDLAFLDDDGFVTITDRINRFSKVAGEMIPHIRVEEAIHAAVNATEQICIVTAVPDERKGERLVVLALKDIDHTAVRETFKAQGLPNLWVPDPEMFFKITAIPVLGSGKLDLFSIKRLAREFALPSEKREV